MITADLSDAFFDLVRSTSETLGCQPIDLLGVMMNESGVRATARNQSSDASGLIQFMPTILVGLGWDAGPAAFRELTAEQQMPYVERFFRPYVNQGLSPAARLYQATFLPATLGLGSELDTAICGIRDGDRYPQAYQANVGFDTDHKGYITVGDLQQAIDRACHGARWEEIVARLDGTFVDGGVDLSGTAGIQAALIALGYDPGPVDGIWGPHTADAVRKFQSDQGLSETDGQVGPETVGALAAALDGLGIAHFGE